MDRETLRLRPGSLAPGALRLVVLEPSGPSTHVLPASGKLVLGRGSGADVRIDEASISRKHAVLRLDPLRLEDLGSANGTRVRDRALQPGEVADLHVGDSIELGSVLCVVQRETPQPKPARLLTHDYFEARVEDEVGRAERGAGQFGVLRVHAGVASPEAALAAVSATLRPGDVVAAYGPGEYEVLLVDAAPPAVEETARQLSLRLGKLSRGVAVGQACFPRDARAPAALIAAANQALARALEDPARPAAVPAAEAPPALARGAMERLHKLVERVAESSISVVLLGETGVGKSALAAQIHQRSPRAKQPFVSLNCAAMAESLLESELFGHEKGSFTGAIAAREGLFEAAQGGTIFLDEVGEMPLGMQAKLLEVLEERAVRRVGGTKKKPIDVRVISATNRDLETAAAEGRFRSDLWFRLNGIALVVPPLRERPQEIAGLSRSFAEYAARTSGRTAPSIEPQALAALERLPWPGNIRELRNAIERAVLLCGDGPITLEHLPLATMRATVYARAPGPAPGPAAAASPATTPATPAPPPVSADPREVERRRIASALEQCGGNQGRAAALLGISRRTLVTRLSEHGLPRPRKR